MPVDASEILGAQQIAGVMVNQRGAVKGGLGGTSGGYAATWATWRGAGLPFGPSGHLAVTQEEVALIIIKAGILKPRLGDVALRAPRGEVVSALLGRTMFGFGGDTFGLARPLTIKFADGRCWELEVPLPPSVERGGGFFNGRRGRAIVDLLAGET